MKTRYGFDACFINSILAKYQKPDKMIGMKIITTKSALETQRLAASIGKLLRGGEIFALFGNLGSGKTVFAKGLAKGLGIKEKVASPTFNIMKIYTVEKGKKIKPFLFCHIDVYRIRPTDLKNIGAEEYFGKNRVITVIEWADKIKGLLPRRRINVDFTADKKNNERRIKFTGSIDFFKQSPKQ